MKAFFKLRRFRLAIYSTLVFAGILAAIFGGGLALLRHEELNLRIKHVNRALTASMSELKEKQSTPEINEVIENYPTVSVAFYNRKDTLLSQAGAIKGLVPGTHNGFQTINGVLCVVQNSGQTQWGRAVVAESWADRADFLNRFTWFLVIVFLPLVFAGGSAAYYASKKVFTPLDDMSKQAEAMTADQLGARLTDIGNDEFSQFARRLNRFLDQIQESVESQERFVSDAAHELRTPLTVIRSEIEATLLKPRDKDEYVQALETTLEEAERLSRLVEMLLISAGRVEQNVPAIEVGEVCMLSISKWTDRLAQQGMVINASIDHAPAEILADELETVMDNLFSNTLRYGKENSDFQLSLAIHEGQVVIDFCDQGEGIPSAMHEKIFDRFFRTEKSRNRNLGGFGIGLSVCKRLIEQRKGTIRSLPSDQGAHFQIKLPLAPPDA